MKKVIIIGCGFAGFTAAQILSKHRKEVEVTLIDKSKYFNFLPALPDTIGRGINPEYLTYPIEKLCRGMKSLFVNEEVTALSLENKAVSTSSQKLPYDYLIISSGSETNFYGNDQLKQVGFKLDDAADAGRIIDAIERKIYAHFIVSGGGYTGIEVATNLRICLNRRFRQGRIIIVERAPGILGPLPEWMKVYCAENLKNLGIEVFTNSTVEKAQEGEVFISGKGLFENAMLIWAAGVKTADYIQALKLEKSPQGRVKVDNYLRAREDCFVVGDCANFSHKNNFLRMAVQFSIFEGACAAKNILRSIRGRGPVQYKPVDLGYIIPMANNCSCGRVMGMNLKGMLPTIMHYAMCLYRLVGFRNKIGIIKALITGGER